LEEGISVKIEEKNNQGTGKLTGGKIKRILTKSENHPYGIKVELEDCKIGRVKEILEPLKDTIESLESNGLVESIKEPKLIVGKKIPSDESDKIEFKSSFKFDSKRFEKGDGKKVANKDVEKEVSITTAAFANAKGGELFIGIRDNGDIYGLENDYELLNNPNDDKFQRIMWQSIQNYVKDMNYVSKLEIKLLPKNNNKICFVKVVPSNEPIFIHDNNTEECYVRIGPKSEKFNPSDFLKYCRERFS